MLQKFSIIVFLFITVNIFAESNKMAIIPFYRDFSIQDEEYNGTFNSFYKIASENTKYEILNNNTIIDKLKEIAPNNDFRDPSSDINYYINIGENLGVDYLVIGQAGLRFGDGKKYFLSVYLIDVKKRYIKNELFWNTGFNSNILQFSRNAAYKLFQINKNIFPFKIKRITNNQENIKTDNYYKEDIFKSLSNIDFPENTELSYINIEINEKRESSAIGCIGCITIIGTFFLPYYKTTSNISIQIEFQYLTSDGIRTKTFNKQVSDEKYYKLTEDNYYTITDNLYNETMKQLLNEIKSDKQLFDNSYKLDLLK
jgi:hypothetical protein